MVRLFKFCLVLSALLSFAFASFAQGFSGLGFDQGISSQQQEEMITRLKKESPALAKFEERLLTINNEIQTTMNDYMAGKLSRESAKQRLKPLLKESIEIYNNTEYLIEQQLDMLLSTR